MISHARAGKCFLALWVLTSISSPFSWANKGSQDHQYTYTPSLGVGYHLDISELPGTASLIHGPIADFKLTIENNGTFLFPDFSASILMGLEKSFALAYAYGFGVGVVNEEQTGFWGGVKFQNIMDYKTSQGALLRLGLFFQTETKHRIDLELNYGNMPEERVDASLEYSVFGLMVTYGLF